MEEPILVDFSWQVPESGYQWVEARRPDEDTPHAGSRSAPPRAGHGPCGATSPWRRIKPSSTRSLTPRPPRRGFWTLRIGGALGLNEPILIAGEGSDADRRGRGEWIDTWLWELQDMRVVLELWNAITQGRVEQLEECGSSSISKKGGRGISYYADGDRENGWHTRAQMVRIPPGAFQPGPVSGGGEY